MAYDFDAVVERRSGDSYKWNIYAGRDVIPMPVADMDFKAPPAVIAALQERLDHGVFGYADATPAVFEAIGEMLFADYGWSIDPSWLVWSPGLEVALNVFCRLAASPRARVMCSTPIYPPFLSAPRNTGRKLDAVPLSLDSDGYRFDAAAVDAAMTPETELFMACNPQNPSGHVMTRGELESLAQVCLKHDLLICSDEIHCGLVLDADKHHIPLATLSPEVAKRTITLMSPSKTYNLAGLMWAFAIIPDAGLRRRFKRAARGIITEVNAFGYAACVAAYRDSQDWHNGLLDYLRGNRDLVESVVGDLPGMWMPHVEATYLAWLDCRGATLSDDPVGGFERAGIGLSDGSHFGAPGFVRLNFGCPRSVLKEGLQRIRNALSSTEGL
jgi:cysteine-S-conjugate beta-lyase